MNIANWLASTALRAPDSPALLTGDRLDCAYGEFSRRAAALAGALARDFAVRPGDRVALCMANRTEYLECLYAIWWAGAVAVPVNAKLHPREAAWIVGHAGARILFVDADAATGLSADVLPGGVVLIDATAASYRDMREGASDAAPAGRMMSDLAWIFYTSGTTGRPKGAMLTHANLVAMSMAYPVDVDPVSAEDAALYAAPISHGAGLYNFIHVRCGARHVVPASGGFDPDEIFDLAGRLRQVSMFAAPTMVRRLVDAARASGRDGDGIKTIVYGGGPMYRADAEAALAVLGPRLVQIYGQGETPMTITALGRADHADPQKLGSAGYAHSVVEVHITGEDGKVLPAGTVGEIEVRGLTVMAGYWNNEEATRAALRDGWLRTGDVGRMDETSFLTLTDRSKDVIISGGSNIYPREVEEVLLEHEGVREVSVIGAPDPEWGEVVVAFVVAAAGGKIAEEELDALCLASIGRFKRPKRYVFQESLPRNNYGKVEKTKLREQWAARAQPVL